MLFVAQDARDRVGCRRGVPDLETVSLCSLDAKADVKKRNAYSATMDIPSQSH